MKIKAFSTTMDYITIMPQKIYSLIRNKRS